MVIHRFWQWMELLELKTALDFDKDRKNVRILVWGEHCALI